MPWLESHWKEIKSRSPIIQCISQLLVGDPGVLNREGRGGVTKLSLNRRDISGFLREVPAHGVAVVMGRVTPYPGQTAHLVEHRIEEWIKSPPVLFTLLFDGFFRQYYLFFYVEAKRIDYFFQSWKTGRGVLGFFIALNLLLF